MAQDRLDYLAETYKLLEAILNTSKYSAGDSLTIADFAIISSVSSIDIVLPIDKTKYPHLVAYKTLLEQLPYYHEANQVGSVQLREMIFGKLAENREKAAK